MTSTQRLMNYDFFHELLRDRSAKEFQKDGQTYRAKYRRGRGDKLLVLFHPAMPAYSSNRPYFLPFFPLDVPQLSISDPTLEGRSDLPAGWYLGAAGQDVVNTVSRLAMDFSRFLECRKRIYIGGSSGGFASLLYSSLDEASIAIAACPQIDLDTYMTSPVRAWVHRCYGELLPSTTIKQLTGVDLLSTYSGDFKNSALVLVSPGDFTHLHGQLAPFLSCISPKHRQQIIVDVSYHGIPGHGGSVPFSSCMPWIQAVYISDDFTATSILNNYYALTSSQNSDLKTGDRSGTGSVTMPAHSSRDINLASLLAHYSLPHELQS